MATENSNQETLATVVAEEQALGDAAYNQLLSEFEALDERELILINVDVPAVVTLVLGSLPEIREVATEIASAAPHLDLAAINKLRLYALALSYAHARYLAAVKETGGLEALAERGAPLRDILLSDVSALARRGLVDQGKLNELQGVTGYKNLAVDLTILASILKDHWHQIQGKCAVTASEIEEALRLAERIYTTLGVREQGPASVDATTDLRLRAFTALAKNYDELRAAVAFVRRKVGDADKIAPSIYTGRTRRRASSDVVPAEPANPPTVTSGTAPAASTPTAPASTAKTQEDPGAEPFMSK